MQVADAYEKLGKISSLYDGMMTNSTLTGRMAIKYFWQLDNENYEKFVKQAFAGIPKDFEGKLLEVPIGTGILSLPIYKNLNAEIIGVDFSKTMLEAANKNAKKLNLRKIKLIQGDVKNLPFESEFFDTVLSINGFHVFNEKKSAYEETQRILKFGGKFCGCMYVHGENFWTDFFVKNFCERFGYFMPPYETLKSLNERLKKFYRQVEISHVESFAGFICTK